MRPVGLILFVGALLLDACAGARQAGTSKATQHDHVSHPMAPVSASQSADAPTNDTVNRSTLAKDMERRCADGAGDPRAWAEFTPTECDDFDMQAAYSYCTWVVGKDGVGIRAVSQWLPVSAPPSLPFQPSFVPRHEVVVCPADAGFDESMLPKQRVSSVTELENGFLVGYDTGEFGGGLYWYARNGDLQQRILTDNLIRVVRVKNRFLAFTGIAHMFTNEGEATLLEFDGRFWKIVHSIDLTGRPFAFLDEPDGSFLIATSHRLVRVSDARRVEVLYRSEQGFRAPGSIAKDADGTLYVGGRYVVVRLRPHPVGFSETWLAPPGATRPRPPGE